MSESREIPQRELRNNVAGVLREVAAGARLTVTVRGRPVAELVPVRERPAFVARFEVERLVADAPLDPAFSDDVDAVVGDTIEDM